MPALTPVITTTPAPTATYNPQMAETFSWLPVTNTVRPLYAKAVYDVGTNKSLNGATLFTGTTLSAGAWNQINALATASISVTATNWDGDPSTTFSLTAGASIYGVFTAIKLASGSVIAYKG
jgi:hypothetical protein